MENVHFDWFNQYVYTGEHFQWDQNKFWFDFMFVKPRDVPPKFSFNMVKSLMSRAVEIKIYVSLHVKAKHPKHIVWFHKPKSEPKYV